VTIDTDEDIIGLTVIGRIVAQTLQAMMEYAKVGMTTLELDDFGRRFLEKHGALSSPMLTYQFPGTTCISINEEAAHGIPSDRVMQAGDMVNIDVSAELNCYVADTGGSFVLPPASPEKLRLCHATKLALKTAISKVKADRPLNVIGKAIQQIAKQKGYKIIRNLCSHGVGRHLHEEPKMIPGFYDPRDKRKLVEGMVITIEPFLSSKASQVVEAEDGWTLKGPKGNISAQYEHTMIITKNKPIILTSV